LLGFVKHVLETDRLLHNQAVVGSVFVRHFVVEVGVVVHFEKVLVNVSKDDVQRLVVLLLSSASAARIGCGIQVLEIFAANTDVLEAADCARLLFKLRLFAWPDCTR
jgi:hypothetical protein